MREEIEKIEWDRLTSIREEAQIESVDNSRNRKAYPSSGTGVG